MQFNLFKLSDSKISRFRFALSTNPETRFRHLGVGEIEGELDIEWLLAFVPLW